MLAYLLAGSPLTIYKRLDSSSPNRGIASHPAICAQESRGFCRRRRAGH